jgi:hypothetical protein
MAHKRRIRAEDIVPDILNGMSHGELMRKYRLSARGLRSAFSKLVEMRVLTVEDLHRLLRKRPQKTVVIDELSHLSHRHLTLNLPIEDLTRPGETGTLWYVTEKNFAVTGIESQAGEVKSFAIPCRKYLRARSISFEAECLWYSRQMPPDPSVTAFRITKISTWNLAHLRELIQVATLTIG